MTWQSFGWWVTRLEKQLRLMAPRCSGTVVTIHVSAWKVMFTNHFSRSIGYTIEYEESSMRLALDQFHVRGVWP
ncbi:hypothetical protein LINPERHAP2_LOCUS4386 [Linum perenne]